MTLEVEPIRKAPAVWLIAPLLVDTDNVLLAMPVASVSALALNSETALPTRSPPSVSVPLSARSVRSSLLVNPLPGSVSELPAVSAMVPAPPLVSETTLRSFASTTAILRPVSAMPFLKSLSPVSEMAPLPASTVARPPTSSTPAFWVIAALVAVKPRMPPAVTL